MHLLLTQSGAIDAGGEPQDLGQTPADIVALSFAETELALLAAAHAELSADAAQPSLRLANLARLAHNYSVDLYTDAVLAHAKVIVLRLLGGKSYWSYGVERACAVAAQTGAKLIVLPGCDARDVSLERLSTIDAATRETLWAYLREGGMPNARGFLAALAHLVGAGPTPPPPCPLPKAGPYAPAILNARGGRPRAALIFYRALAQSGDLRVVDAMARALDAAGLQPQPVYVASLRDEDCEAALRSHFSHARPDVIVTMTAFAAGASKAPPALAETGAVVLQAMSSGESEAAWADAARGVTPQALAMHVSLPELDGRITTRAVGFRAEAAYDAATQHYLTRSEPKTDRVEFVAQLASAWTRLRRTPAPERRIGMILANYPNRDARLGNGVGLDTPQSAGDILAALAGAGYDVGEPLENSDALIAAMLDGPTNAATRGRAVRETLPLPAYNTAFAALPAAVCDAMTERWGPPEADPSFTDGAFSIAVRRYGNVALGVQPARGYNIDPKATYHAPDLVPPHGYFAFYAWLRHTFGAHALIHLGKHGNLEWLPGKSVALSAECFPEAMLGPTPNIYPFIVNDPGEGAQAKRRAGAVVIDHLTPPMTRAESYGPLKEMEALLDEYAEAADLDERRRRMLGADILATARRLGLDKDCGAAPADGEAETLRKLDAHLCDLKEMQIRDGLHIFGRSPSGAQRADLLAAVVRAPRGQDEGDGSLIAALAADLGLGFDPLAASFAEPWSGPRPHRLAATSGAPWRTAGDAVERLELLSRSLIVGEQGPEPEWTRTAAVLEQLRGKIAPALDDCGAAEMRGLLTALDGRFVAPGPSGAPTRGRPDVLPTGRNFYSFDCRAAPTPAAWELGRTSAEALVARYVQDHGDWPRAIVMSAWGTANMRTGGDDIAQALALMGVKPVWEPSSRRVTGYEVIPLAKMDRPRVDVTFRVSGMFRDAFPAQIDLLDSAARAVAALDEPAADNPLAAAAAEVMAALVRSGAHAREAHRLATARVFGSKPGAYGAGLQALIDENLWETDADFAESYLVWGQYAYGAGLEGRAARDALEDRLGRVDAVIHNQDNREHDILDSDDYYQFQGGLAAAVKALKGRPVRVYHNDHSRPERPVIRALEEEIGRVVRGRAANPKWIAGVMRHGYKGAFEMAATVDYLYAYAATTGLVGDHHFDAVYDAYLGDETVRAFIAEKNPHALVDIAARFKSAIDRGLWTPRSNHAGETLAALSRSAP
ncbi:MAG: cobaltochelatase subunit CobN [Hyphomicrobiales bacterium]|nr:cobaltochelatase subunit CobN [Hyphomicrobiales bacterium]